ncbi:MAG: ribonuclease D [Paraglaciecola sp.]|jgi:ribonuclease D
MPYTFVTTDSQLADFCQQASHVPAIAVDTEFVRTRTLYPQLGLIQIYDGQQLVLVDPLEISDFAPLKNLLSNPDIVKVLHSCSEDLETFWHAFKIMPEPIFDTQFAASAVGLGVSMGYAKLVELMLDIQVDKGESRTDWLARPLRKEQCDYAAKDVLYLFELYPELKRQTEEQDKLSWVYGEMHALSVKKKNKVPLDMSYLGYKHNWQLSGKALYVLQKLAAWRVETARKRDLSLNFVVREQHLLEVARRQPSSMQELNNVSGLTPQEVRIHGQAMLDIISASESVTAEQYPPRVERLTDFAEYKQTVAALKEVSMAVAEQFGVPIELVGSKKQLNQLIKWCWFKQEETREMGLRPDLIDGWRKSYFYPLLLKIPTLKLAQCDIQDAN